MTSANLRAENADPVEIRALTASEGPAFAAFTAPAFRGLLALEALPPGVYRLGAFLAGKPAALLLSCPAAEGMQDISSIMVAPEWRGRGLARALLDRLISLARTDGRRGLVARWSDRLPRAREFAALLQSSGWSAPVETRRRMTWRVGDWRKGFPKRDALLFRLRTHGLVDRSLSELGEAGIEDLVRQNEALIAARRAPEWSRATGWLPEADRDVSVALYDANGALAGWMACAFQPQFGRWFVPQGWVVVEKVPLGWLIGGIASLCRRLEEKAGPEALLIAQPPSGFAGGMEKMLFKHFGRHAVATDFLRESEVLFQPESG